MSLFNRIAKTPGSGDRVSVHTLTAMLREYARGFVTRADFVAVFDLKEGVETPHLDTLLGKINAASNATAKLMLTIAIDDILILTESRFKYTTQAEFNARLSAL